MDITKEEFSKNVVKAFLLKYASKNNNDYEFNPEKCDKMNAVIAYCEKLESEYNCKIIRCMLEPKYVQGYIQILFDGEFAIGEKAMSLKEFTDTLTLCDGVNISANPAGDDMFQITFFIEDLWLPKTK